MAAAFLLEQASALLCSVDRDNRGAECPGRGHRHARCGPGDRARGRGRGRLDPLSTSPRLPRPRPRFTQAPASSHERRSTFPPRPVCFRRRIGAGCGSSSRRGDTDDRGQAVFADCDLVHERIGEVEIVVGDRASTDGLLAGGWNSLRSCSHRYHPCSTRPARSEPDVEAADLLTLVKSELG